MKGKVQILSVRRGAVTITRINRGASAKRRLKALLNIALKHSKAVSVASSRSSNQSVPTAVVTLYLRQRAAAIL